MFCTNPLRDPEGYEVAAEQLAADMEQAGTLTLASYREKFQLRAAEIFDKHVCVVDERRTPEQEAEQVRESNEWEAKREEESKQREQEVKAIASSEEYKHLTPLTRSGTCIDNVRADLRKEFPGIKFSVTQERGRAMNIRWTDGPTQKQVQAVTGKYDDHSPDPSGDYHDYTPSNFNRAFGGSKYIFTSRDYSQYAEQKFQEWGTEQWAEPHSGERFNCTSAEQLGRSLMRNSTIYRDFEIVPTGETSGLCEVQRFFTTKDTSTPEQPEGGFFRESGWKPAPQGSINVQRNESKGGIEIKFPGKPSQDILDSLHRYGFRWSRPQKLWWAKFTESKWEFALTLIGKEPEAKEADGSFDLDATLEGDGMQTYAEYQDSIG